MLLIVGIGVVWILNLASIIQGNWAILLFAILLALSISLAFFLWGYADDQAYEAYLGEVKEQLKKKPETGAVVVRARKKLLGQEVQIGDDPTCHLSDKKNRLPSKMPCSRAAGAYCLCHIMWRDIVSGSFFVRHLSFSPDLFLLRHTIWQKCQQNEAKRSHFELTSGILDMR
jgi:hypothetical protein